jgi:hypothetical protein
VAERAVFRGDHLAVARGAQLALFEVAGDRLRRVSEGSAPADVAALAVAPHAPWVVGRDAEHRQVWWWRPGDGARILAQPTGARDHAIGSLVEIAGESFVALSQGGRLRLLRGDGGEAAALAIDQPTRWACHAFVQLPGGRVAILGNIAGEPTDMVLVVPARALLAGPDTIQRALASTRALDGALVHDRAIALVVGPGPGETMVALRDPEDEEPPPDASDEADEYPDVWGLRGAYLRDLTSRALIEPTAWDVRFAKLAAVCATARVIAVETGGGVDVRDRATGAVDHVAGAVLDPLGARLAIPDDRGWGLRVLPG